MYDDMSAARRLGHRSIDLLITDPSPFSTRLPRVPLIVHVTENKVDKGETFSSKQLKRHFAVTSFVSVPNEYSSVT